MNVVTIDKEQPEQCNQQRSESDDGPGNEESDDAIDADPGKTSSSNASGSGLLTKKKTKSAIWSFFEFIDENHERRELASCRTCEKNVVAH